MTRRHKLSLKKIKEKLIVEIRIQFVVWMQQWEFISFKF